MAGESDGKMKELTGICLVTADVGRLRTFYEQLLEAAAEGDDSYCAFSGAKANLVIYSVSGTEAMAPGAMEGAGSGSCFLEYAVADVDAEYARLAGLGVAVVKPPTTQPWGVRSVWFRDPDGNLINFAAPAAAD